MSHPWPSTDFSAYGSPAHTACEVIAMNKEQFGLIRGWMYVVGVAIMAGAFRLTHR
jgi:hypothetical protein